MVSTHKPTAKACRYSTWRHALLIICLCLAWCYSQQGHAKTYVVCVGVQNYPGRENDLTLPVKDAKAMKQLFERNGNTEVILLTDQKATRANIIKAMRQMFSKATPNDAIAIYFSGHGSKGALTAYDEHLNYKVIRDIFVKSKAGRRFALIDACHSGSMRKTEGYAQLKGKNIMFFLSSRTNETSIEYLQLKNGIFTDYLIRALKGGADADKNRVITAKELFDFVSAGVIKESKGEQHPVMWGDFSNNMPVMTW